MKRTIWYKPKNTKSKKGKTLVLQNAKLEWPTGTDLTIGLSMSEAIRLQNKIRKNNLVHFTLKATMRVSKVSEHPDDNPFAIIISGIDLEMEEST